MTDELGVVVGLPRQIGKAAPFYEVLQADPCAYCGGPGGTVDHIVAKGRGARRADRSAAMNGTGACVACNNAKARVSVLRFLLGEQRQDQGTAPNDRCVTGKRIYYQERLACRVITKAILRGELPRLRHYRCSDCNWWHLSRKADRAAPREGREYPALWLALIMRPMGYRWENHRWVER